MTLELPSGAGIGDDDVTTSAPLVRAMVVQRLEMIWRTCQPHIEVPTDVDGVPLYKADPRFIEAGIRVTDRLARLYRLDAPQPQGPEPVAGSRQDLRGLAEKQLGELEARMRGQEEEL